MAVITISGQIGAGILPLADKVCEKTGFHLVDENIINEVLRKEKIRTNWINALEKEAASNTLYIISSIISHTAGSLVSGIDDEQEDERKRYIKVLTHIMTEMAYKGGFVIIGRGAQFILKDHPKAIHIYLLSEYEKRVRLIAETFKISPSKAKKMIREKEKESAHIATNLFKEDIDDTSHYHLVLNTSKMPLEWAIDMVLYILEKQINKEEYV